jgi:hypothetical protein
MVRIKTRCSPSSVPALEKRFHLIPDANARFLTGGSTGGWECAALQIQRPDFFGGAWCLYPDPVDFRRNQTVDIYADSNAFFPNNALPPVPERSMSRTPEGQDLLSFPPDEQTRSGARAARREAGQQFDAWDAAYGPGRAADGYPKRSVGPRDRRHRQERRRVLARPRI